MLKFLTHKAILLCASAKGFTFTATTFPTLKPYLPAISSPFFLRFQFYSTTSDPHFFTVSYLVNNCGFSPESALKASQKLHFDNPQKPDSVLAFFRNRGFSNSHIHAIIKRELRILLSDPEKVLLPKIEFLRSKGASTSDIVYAVSATPRFLTRSLNNHIIPSYELVSAFLQSDKQTLACLNRNLSFLCDGRLALNIILLLDHGVKRRDIAKLLRMWPSIFCSSHLLKTVEELKELGFDPSISTFSIALLARRTVKETRWAEKIDTFMKWGWSQEHVLQAFKRQPYCMLASPDKINAVFSFWVNQLGWNALDLVKAPGVFVLSLQKRIIPRASVLKFLVSKGLRKMDASLNTPLAITEKLFIEKYVKRFEEDSSHLLKLYEEKMNLAIGSDNSST